MLTKTIPLFTVGPASQPHSDIGEPVDMQTNPIGSAPGWAALCFPDAHATKILRAQPSLPRWAVDAHVLPSFPIDDNEAGMTGGDWQAYFLCLFGDGDGLTVGQDNFPVQPRLTGRGKTAFARGASPRLRDRSAGITRPQLQGVSAKSVGPAGRPQYGTRDAESAGSILGRHHEVSGGVELQHVDGACGYLPVEAEPGAGPRWAPEEFGLGVFARLKGGSGFTTEIGRRCQRWCRGDRLTLGILARNGGGASEGWHLDRSEGRHSAVLGKGDAASVNEKEPESGLGGEEAHGRKR